jgi:tRNA(Ile)-lysidine synthase
MIKLLHKLPDNSKFHIAVSGGVDSISAFHWLLAGNRRPFSIIHINHNTGDYADKCTQLVKGLAAQHNITLHMKKLTGKPPSYVSAEAWWRERRYEFFDEVHKTVGLELPIILAHNLDDVLEQYIISTTVRIKSYKLISYKGPSNVIRPFLTWRKNEIIAYAKQHNLKFHNDPTNYESLYLRSAIRNQIVPLLLNLNPGLYKLMKKLLIEEAQAIKQT